MIHIFGDSHANFNFRNIKYNNVINHYQNSITLFRVGRDKLNFINFKYNNIRDNDIVIYQFGEVDCRCHIGRQLLAGRKLDEIINELIENYIISIKENMKDFKNLKIIICCAPPTMHQEKYEEKHGPITHEFPFIGKNSERKYYTENLNQKLKQACIENNFYFLNYYYNYIDEEGLLNYSLSDEVVHIVKNENLLNQLYSIIDNL